MLLTVLRSLSIHWKYYTMIEPMALASLHAFGAIVYTQNFHAIPQLEGTPPSTTPADILFIMAGLTLMLISFFDLITRSRALGSSFLLPLAILSSTGLTLLFALRIALALNLRIHPLLLSRALPFLISIIGFNKPLRIARAIFHSHLAWTLHPSEKPLDGSPIPFIIVDSLTSVSPFITRDSFLEMTFFTFAISLPIGDLDRLCSLAALSVAIHYAVISSYFVSILSVILGGCTLRIMHDIITNLTTPTLTPPSKPSYLSSLLGKKGTSIYNPSYTIKSTTVKIIATPPDSEKDVGRNPLPGLRLLIFASLFLFHCISPFALSHYPSNQSISIPNTNTNRTFVQISSFNLPILQDHLVLSISFLVILCLFVLVNASLFVFQVIVVINPNASKRLRVIEHE